MTWTLLIAVMAAPGDVRPKAKGRPRPEPPKAAVVLDAEGRREARDEVLRLVGPEALGFTTFYGDLGIAVLLGCSPDSARALVRLHQSGALARLGGGWAVLEAVLAGGTPAATWLARNHAKLEDPDALSCWCREPLDYAYRLKDIGLEAERLRARRPPPAAPPDEGRGVGYLWLAAMAVVLAALAYRKWRAAS